MPSEEPTRHLSTRRVSIDFPADSISSQLQVVTRNADFFLQAFLETKNKAELFLVLSDVYHKIHVIFAWLLFLSHSTSF